MVDGGSVIYDPLLSIFDVFEDESGGGLGAVVAVVGGEVFFHGFPEGRVVGKDVGDAGGEGFGGVGEVADVEVLEELEVSLFLAGDDVVDEHGASGGDGFVGGGSAGFADDEVVLVEELGDFFGPAFDGDPSGVGGFNFLGAAVEAAEVFSEDYGEVDVG